MVVRCEVCRCEYAQQAGLSRHRTSSGHGRRTKVIVPPCPTCGKKFLRADVRKMHMAAYAVKNNSIKECCTCPTCGKSFPTTWRLKRHVGQHMKIPKVKVSSTDVEKQIAERLQLWGYLTLCQSTQTLIGSGGSYLFVSFLTTKLKL